MASSEDRPVFRDGKTTIRLPARREAFATLRDWLGGIIDGLTVSPKIRSQILIAADEVFTNIASYAYPTGGESGTIEIEVRLDNPGLTVTFSDSGVPFNPLETPAPELEADVENRPIGGLGIFLVRKLMDSVEYRRENDRNVLLFRKDVSAKTE